MVTKEIMPKRSRPKGVKGLLDTANRKAHSGRTYCVRSFPRVSRHPIRRFLLRSKYIGSYET